MTIKSSGVESKAGILDNIVDEIVNRYTDSLDELVVRIKNILMDKDNPITTEELEDCVLELPVELYFASNMTEKIGIREDISKMIYQEAYTLERSKSTGTVQDKNTYAELQTQNEKLTNIAYSRSFKIVKAKCDNAQELLESCKKILTLRIAELDITRVGGNK